MCVLFIFSWKLAVIGAGAAAGAAVAVFGLPFVVAHLGYTATGIVGGSIAAWMMSLYGGVVTKGSVVAVLQSIGAAGMGSVATAITAAFGAVVGYKVTPNQDEREEAVESLATCLMLPCGGNLDERQAAAVLNGFGRGGINAIHSEAEKTGLKKCLKTIALMASRK